MIWSTLNHLKLEIASLFPVWEAIGGRGSGGHVKSNAINIAEHLVSISISSDRYRTHYKSELLHGKTSALKAKMQKFFAQQIKQKVNTRESADSSRREQAHY